MLLHVAADYALLCVDALTGITRITREHLAVAVALEVPTALVITKADAVDDAQLQQLISQLELLMQPVLQGSCQGPQHNEQHGTAAQDNAASDCSSSDSGSDDGSSYTNSSSSQVGGGEAGPCGHHGGGVPVVGSEAQAVSLASSLSELHSCTAAPAAPSFQQVVFPVFVTSCVNGAGVPLLHAFLSHLKPLQHTKQGDSSAAGHTPQPNVAADVVTAALPASQVQQQQPHQRTHHHRLQQQPHVSPGLKPAARDGSSQLWGVSSSPPQPQLQARAGGGSAAAAAAPSCGAGPGACQQQGAGGEGDSCRPGHFQVVHTYDVEGVGWVVSGIAVTGRQGAVAAWGLFVGEGWMPAWCS